MTDLPSMLMPIQRRDRNGNEIRPGMRLIAHGCTMYILTVPTLYAVLDRGSRKPPCAMRPIASAPTTAISSRWNR